MAAPASKVETSFAGGAGGDDRGRRAAVPGRPSQIKPGMVLQGRYQIQDVLGIGGMSTVYRARDLRFAGVERTCAVKEMFHPGDDQRLRQLRLTNFQREAALLATLSHPAIPRIYDFFEQQASIYLVLELIPGHDLETMLSQRGEPFAEDQLLTWSLELCDVLSYLHAQEPEPIIFRDLKPSNIMIRAGGALTLVDFGIARAFAPQQRGTMIGTEGYAPPEQYRGVADVRGDIYAFGATLHHLATGADPRSETPFTFAQRPPRRLNPKLSPEFEQLILKSAAYTPADRYESVRELSAALEEVQQRRVTAVGGVAAAKRSAASGSGILAPPANVATATGPLPSVDERLSWVVATADEVRGSASHAGGAVYVGSYDGFVYAIDETDGTVRWRFRSHRGVVSRPLPATELVIFGSEDHNVYAVSRQQGRAIWSFRTTMPVRSSAGGGDRVVYIGSDDGFLYGLDRARGSVIWRYRTWGPVRSTPLVHNRRVIFGSDDGYLYSVDRDTGQLGWRTHINSPLTSSPAVVGSTVVVGAGDGVVRGFAIESGKVAWSYPTGKAVIASPVFADQTVYIGSANGRLYALDAATGALNWETALSRQVTSTATIDGEVLYVGGTDGRLFCLNRADGATKWHVQTGGPIVAKPLVTPDHVIVGSLDGKVYAVHRSNEAAHVPPAV